ncbi:MAG: Uma2 family endonuclease [Lachnospiraceae bacterium]|nr:Uma2 family endonuclease [Lachnospiraceae bacterium]
MPLPKEQIYTVDDIYDLPDGQRAELVDGQIYYMAPPSRRHQDILSFLHLVIGNYIHEKKGNCKIYPAPFAVFLFEDDRNYLEPDLSVICDKGKLNDKGCNGAPDWVIEIVSPGSKLMDYYTKLGLYRSAGVREYWIVDPMRKNVLVYDMEHGEGPVTYSFSDVIPVTIYPGFSVDFGRMDS